MIAVIFEVWPSAGRADEYFDLAATLRADLERIDGFVSIEPQAKGRGGVFADYRLRVASVMRDYGLSERSGAPRDSRDIHG